MNYENMSKEDILSYLDDLGLYDSSLKRYSRNKLIRYIEYGNVNTPKTPRKGTTRRANCGAGTCNRTRNNRTPAVPKTPAVTRTPAVTSPDDETLCAIGTGDKRRSACARNDIREDACLNLLRGDTTLTETEQALFPVRLETLVEFVNAIHTRFPTLPGTVKKIAGRGKNYDYSFQDETNTMRTIELKTSEKAVDETKLRTQPWSGFVEFFQATFDTQSEIVQALRPFSEPLFEEWYTIVQEELMPHFGVNITKPHSLGSYRKGVYSRNALKKGRIPIGMNAANLDFFHAVNETVCGEGSGGTAQKEFLAKRWKTFLQDFAARNQPPLDAIANLVKTILNKKDYWICIVKNGAFLIDGPKCIDIEFKQVKTGRDVPVFLYTIILQVPGEEPYKLEMEFRITWRNCGQGAYMLAFQLK